MSQYGIVSDNEIGFENSNCETDFFKRYYTQVRASRCFGLNHNEIWNQFCKINNIEPQKQWSIPKVSLKKLNNLSDNEIYQLIGMAISSFFKGDYKGQGI